MNVPLPADDTARRRRLNHRLGWALGAAELVLYLLGFFIQR